MLPTTEVREQSGDSALALPSCSSSSGVWRGVWGQRAGVAAGVLLLPAAQNGSNTESS